CALSAGQLWVEILKHAKKHFNFPECLWENIYWII
ncbi:uncharacterized protein METZ01_LOCUS511012, partial [marine metagenome]